MDLVLNPKTPALLLAANENREGFTVTIRRGTEPVFLCFGEPEMAMIGRGAVVFPHEGDPDEEGAAFSSVYYRGPIAAISEADTTLQVTEYVS